MLSLKIRWWMFCHDVERWWHIRKCRKGWHKITTEKVKVQSCKNGKWKTVYDDTFLKCVYCEWLFFPTKEQKEAYQKHKRKEERQNKLWIQALVKGRGKTTHCTTK